VKEKPLVTIALAVRNNISTIRDALSSSFGQTYEPKEVIAADGMSTDGTLEELKKWPLRALLSDGGRGLAYARQILLEEAKGEYVLWVDGDHLLPKDFLEKQVTYMEAHPEVGAVEGVTYPKDGGAVAFTEGITWTVSAFRRARRGPTLTSLGTAATLYRKKAALEAGGFDPAFRVAAEDAMITRSMYKMGWKFAVNPDAWVYHAARSSWKGLWKEYYWWGRGAFAVARKYPGTVSPWKFSPPVATVSGLLNALRAARYTGSAYSLLIPLHNTYKRSAWTWGFISASREAKR
jgi:GT2 family glycosyltransferase